MAKKTPKPVVRVTRRSNEKEKKLFRVYDQHEEASFFFEAPTVEAALEKYIEGYVTCAHSVDVFEELSLGEYDIDFRPKRSSRARATEKEKV